MFDKKKKLDKLDRYHNSYVIYLAGQIITQVFLHMHKQVYDEWAIKFKKLGM